MERTKLITLLITRRCNLRCRYCYVRSYDDVVMSMETARSCISDAFSNAAGSFDRLEFAFLGGEPFCAFDRLREICEWTWSREWPLPYLFSASTNGTLCTREIRQWLAEHRDRFYPSLSFDGLISAQDQNRCGSADRIDLEFFQRHWPMTPVKMTVTEDNVEHLYQNIRLLNDRGIQVNDTFADGVPAWKDSSLRKLDQQLQMLCDAQLAHPQPHASDLLSVDLTRILMPEGRTLFPCEAGTSRVTYDWDGKTYGCHLLSPLVLDERQLAALPTAMKAPGPICSPCSDCELDTLCPSCEGNSFRLNGSLWLREEKTCKLFRHQLYFACVFQMKRILRKGDWGEDDRRVYTSVRHILQTKAMLEVITWIDGNQPVMSDNNRQNNKEIPKTYY